MLIGPTLSGFSTNDYLSDETKGYEASNEDSLPPSVLFDPKPSTEPPPLEFFTDIVSSPEANCRIQSTIHLARIPYLQCIKAVYPSPFLSSRHASTSSFSMWTEKMKEEAVLALLKLGTPLKKVTLHQIYQLLHSHQKEICQNSNFTYPALFKADIDYEEEGKPQPKSSIEIEVHSDKKVSLIFREHEKTFIAVGSFKTLITAYPLGKPKKVFTYSYSRSDVDLVKAKIVMENEERFLPLCGGKPHFVKIYEIFYYNIFCQEQWQTQQVITMKYYPHDLFHILTSDEPHHILSDQMKVSYCLQIAQAVQYLHQNKILHRDLKIENILVNLKEIGLTDFGLTCLEDELEKLKEFVGTPNFLAPEAFSQEVEGKSLDIWALACILWLILSGVQTVYPWYNETCNEFKDMDIDKILKFMSCYDKCPPQNSDMLFLLWNMLRYNPKDRWNIEQVLTFLHEMEKKLPKDIEFGFNQQFEQEYGIQFKEILNLLKSKKRTSSGNLEVKKDSKIMTNAPPQNK